MAVMEQLFIDIRKEASFHCVAMRFHFALPDTVVSGRALDMAPFSPMAMACNDVGNALSGALTFPA